MMDCKERALKYLTIRMRSEKEMRSYLQKKGYANTEIRETIEFLHQYDYLNDEKFCDAFIRDRIAFNPCGKNKLYRDLLLKGVSSTLIQASLGKYFSRETECALAQKMAQKQKALGAEEEKIKRYLYSKGFSYGVILDAMQDISVE